MVLPVNSDLDILPQYRVVVTVVVVVVVVVVIVYRWFAGLSRSWSHWCGFASQLRAPYSASVPRRSWPYLSEVQWVCRGFERQLDTEADQSIDRSASHSSVSSHRPFLLPARSQMSSAGTVHWCDSEIRSTTDRSVVVVVVVVLVVVVVVVVVSVVAAVVIVSILDWLILTVMIFRTVHCVLSGTGTVLMRCTVYLCSAAFVNAYLVLHSELTRMTDYMW